MKNSRFIVVRGASFVAPFLVAFSSTAHAQLTWDPASPLDPWDTVSDSWDDGTAPPWTIWDNTGAQTAIFPDEGASYDVNIADGGVTVGDLTYQGTDRLLFRSVTDNLGVLTIASGGATWNTGGGNILILADTSADASLSISTGDTLTVTGGGIFDAGEKPTGADWVAAGATLDVTEATDVRGNAGSIGQFANVELTGGSFSAERNTNQTFPNDWVLNGDVTFTTRWARQETLTGAISGAGRLTIDSTVFNEGQVDQTYIFSGAAKTYTGGTAVDGTSHVAVLGINNDNQLGTVPGSEDEDNLILRGGGYLRLNGAITLNANRGVTLDNGGGFIASGAASEIAGKITGGGGLIIGRTADGGGNVIQLNNSGNDYTDGTTVLRGTVRLGADNVLGAGGPLTLGGVAGLNSFFDVNGFDATVGGIQIGAGNTREVRNNSGSPSTLTMDVPDGESYAYAANVSGSDALNLVKDGLGTQTFNRAGGYSSGFGDVTVNEGTLGLGNDSSTTPVSGAISVTGGLLDVGETLVGVTSISVTGGTMLINNDSYLGDAPGAPIADFITLDGGSLNVQLTSGTGGSFEIDANRGITLGAGGGTILTTTPSGAWAVTYNGVITGSGGLTKAAAQTLILGGANDYTGPTMITGGTLRLPGSVTSDVTVEAGIFVAGDSATGTGSGTMNALTIDAGGTLATFINSDSVESGTAAVSGAVTIDPAASLTVVDRGTASLVAGTELTLIDYTGGSLSGTFDGLAEGATVTVGSNDFALSYVGGSGSMVTLTAQAGSAYDTWALGFPGLVGGFDDDDDMDGLSNGQEWYFGGTDPLTGGDASPLVGVEATGAGTFEFTHLRPTDTTGATATYEWSSTLVGAWNASGATDGGFTVTLTPGAPIAGDPGYEEVTVTVSAAPTTLEKVFTRVNLTMP